MISRLLCSGIVLAACSAASAHPCRETLAQVELNTKTSSLEVAMRIDALELEAAVSEWAGRRVHLDDREDAEPFIAGYLAERFTARDAGGTLGEPRWIGLEDEVLEVWVYFEVAFESTPAEIELTSTVLMERVPLQVNVVEYHVGAWKQVSLLTVKDAGAELPGGPPEL